MNSLKTSDFDYHLPESFIAQTPIEPRDHSRLLIVNREKGTLTHRRFYDLPEYLEPGDVLVFNNSRVIRARLLGTLADTGKQIEILLLRRLEKDVWETLIRSNKRVKTGMLVELDGAPPIKARVVSLEEGGVRVVRFADETELPRLGKIPLPPYIHEPLSDPERYQTVYAEKEGSVAAPTAGLHFTPGLLDKLKNRGVHCLFVTLHVGLNTFRPVREDEVMKHPVLPEYGIIDESVARQINLAKEEGRRVICVGTTSVRLVESVARTSAGRIEPLEDWANLFIYPGYQFKVTDALITNFHLPKSTLLMLVSALAGKDLIMQAYHTAIEEGYRFYSFGDAMFIV